MEKAGIDKDVGAGIVEAEKESVLSLAVGESVEAFQRPTPPKDSSNVEAKELQLIADEKEQTQHPERSGVAEWKGDAAAGTHLRDSIVYEIEDSSDGAVGSTGKFRLSFYEVTQQRDQSLYEKASCSSDVIRVWNQISLYIKSKLRQGSGVTICGLGTFTYVVSKVTLNPHSNHFLLQRKPIFLLSNMLVNRYKVIDHDEQILGFRVPASPLNQSEVSLKAKVSRAVVEGVVTEVLQTFARALVCGKPIEFPFPFIGKLQVKNRRCKMLFYSEFVQSMGYYAKDGRKFSPTSPETTQFEEVDDSDILPGRITPLNAHIPTESFRSVFHLREVRSVHDFITVTEQDLSRIGCLQVDCLPPLSKSNSMADDLDSDRSNIDLPKSCKPQPSFVWCPPDRIMEEDGTLKLGGEDAGEDGDIDAWIKQVRLRPPSFYAAAAEIAGEVGGEDYLTERPLTPAPSLLSEDEGKVIPISPPPMEPPPEPWELEPGRPCRHTFRPEPLYKPRPSGKYVLDMILPQKVHFANALVNHHYTLCAKSLGVGVVKKHLEGGKFNDLGIDGLQSSFHNP